MDEIKPKPNENIIEILEGLLDDAKKGEIQGIAIAGTMNDACTFNVFEAAWHTTALIGEIRLLERDVVDVYTDIRRKPA